MKKVAVYVLVFTVFGVVIDILVSRTGHEWLGYVFIIPLIVMFADIGYSIKNEEVRKKYVKHMTAIALELLLFGLIFWLTGIADEHMWVVVIAINIVFFTLFSMIIGIAKLSMETNAKLSLALYSFSFVGIFVSIMASVMIVVLY